MTIPERNECRYIVRLPGAYFAAGLIFLLLGIACLTPVATDLLGVDYSSPGEYEFLIIFSVVWFIAGGAYMIMTASLRRLYAYKRGRAFVYRNTFGMEKHFYQEEISYAVIKKATVTVYGHEGQRLCVVEKMMTNFELLKQDLNGMGIRIRNMVPPESRLN